MKIITGNWEGEQIWRDETSYDKMARLVEGEYQKQLDRISGVDDEVVNKVEIDPDDYRDNEQDR